MNIFLFFALILTFTLLFGRVLEYIRVPWVFSALFLGLILSISNPFFEITQSGSFEFLSNLGIYFLLFMIGLELNLKELIKLGPFIMKFSFTLIFAESVLGAIFLHFVFDLSWGIAILTASSFATVGEAILIPILDEFKIIKTKFGQILLGVGTLDDIVELITITIASLVLGNSVGHSQGVISQHFFYFAILFFVPFFLQIYRPKLSHLSFKKMPPLFLFGMIILFAFVGVGSIIDADALGAIFAGVALKSFLSDERLERVEDIVKVVSYGLFVPIFFLHVGIDVDLHYLISTPLMIIAVLLITSIAKIGLSVLIARSRMGTKKSMLLGIGLSAKFSTSIVIITLFFNAGIITLDLYSVLIGAMIVSKFIIPVAFSLIIKTGNLQFEQIENS